MTGAELLRLLRKHGWVIAEGKRHHLATHPERPGVKIPVARHKSKEVPVGTLQEILKQAGLK